MIGLFFYLMLHDLLLLNTADNRKKLYTYLYYIFLFLVIFKLNMGVTEASMPDPTMESIYLNVNQFVSRLTPVQVDLYNLSVEPYDYDALRLRTQRQNMVNTILGRSRYYIDLPDNPLDCSQHSLNIVDDNARRDMSSIGHRFRL